MEHETHDAAVRDLCGRLFGDPARLANTLTHEIAQPFSIAEHTHRAVLQFDLLDGCAGEARCGDVAQSLRGITAMVAYPGQIHGYALRPGDAPSRVYHLKLHVPQRWPIARERVYPSLLTGLPPQPALVRSLGAVMRLGLVQQRRSSMLLARLAEVLALWPRAAAMPAAMGEISMRDGDISGALTAALRLMEGRLDHPPSLEELAHAAHLSPRHFSRCFRAQFGCTPHTWAAARRMERARQMLLGQRLKVGEVAAALGFSSVASFSRWFRQHACISPTRYRQDPTIM